MSLGLSSDRSGSDQIEPDHQRKNLIESTIFNFALHQFLQFKITLNLRFRVNPDDDLIKG